MRTCPVQTFLEEHKFPAAVRDFFLAEYSQVATLEDLMALLERLSEEALVQVVASRIPFVG